MQGRSKGKEVQAVSGTPFGSDVVLVQRDGRLALVGDDQLTSLFTKAASYKVHVGLHMEGVQIELGDFTVGLSRATVRPGESFLGVVLDVAYRPVCDWSQPCLPLQAFGEMLQEAVDAMGGVLQQVDMDQAQRKDAGAANKDQADARKGWSGTALHGLQTALLARQLAAQ